MRVERVEANGTPARLSSLEPNARFGSMSPGKDGRTNEEAAVPGWDHADTCMTFGTRQRDPMVCSMEACTAP